MKGLMFKYGSFYFLVNLKDLLHVVDFEDVKLEKELEIVDFRKFLDENIKPRFVIFLTNGVKYIGVIAERIYDIIEYKEVRPLGNEDLVLNFLSGVVKYKNKLLYMIDCEKLIEGAYEKESNVN